MIQLLERFLILACCSFFAFTHTSSLTVFVFTLLVTIILSSLSGYFDSKNIKFALILFYALLCLFYKEFLYYLPLISFDFFVPSLLYFQLTFIIPVLFHLNDFTTDWLMLLLYYAVSYLMSITLSKLITCQQKLHKLTDEASEIAECLHKKNEEIIANQDFEIKAATLDERNRIAREIHDSVGHQLSSSILQTGALLAITKDELVKDKLTDLKNTLTVSMDSIRHSIHNIHDTSLNLEDKIHGLIQNFDFCPVHFEYQVEHDFPVQVRYSLILIVKEALSNIIKHSNATHAELSIYEHPAFYQILISDNGTTYKKQDSSGMGISGMEERIHMLDGKLVIHTEHGFEIFITLPKKGDNQE